MKKRKKKIVKKVLIVPSFILVLASAICYLIRRNLFVISSGVASLGIVAFGRLWSEKK